MVMKSRRARHARPSSTKGCRPGFNLRQWAVLTTGLLSVALVSSGWPAYPAIAAEEDSSFGVSVEVTFQGLNHMANSPAPIRVDFDQTATVTVSVLATGVPVTITDPSSLLEIEHPSGSRTRFVDWDQTSDTQYRTDITLSEAGTWRFFALPDIEDRSLLPPGSTDFVVVVVEASSPPDTSGAATFGLLILGGLLLALVGLARFVTRRGLPWDHRPKSPSVPHDTWWNSP